MVARLRLSVSALLLSVVSLLPAQIVPLAPGNIQITPDGANEPTQQANTGPYVALFSVKNNYTTDCYGAKGQDRIGSTTSTIGMVR